MKMEFEVDLRREILCLTCKNEVIRDCLSQLFFSGEYNKLYEGRARMKYYCNHCSKSIEKEEICYARSIWRDEDEEKKRYYSWEEGFVCASSIQDHPNE